MSNKQGEQGQAVMLALIGGKIMVWADENSCIVLVDMPFCILLKEW